MSECVVLLSGGLDSTTTLAIAKEQDFIVHALTVDYGQRHSCELVSARRIAESLGAYTHKIVQVNLREIGGSALTADIAVPKDPTAQGNIPVTYVPARNTILLAIALAHAEVLGVRDIFIGISHIDYSGYPDCRPEFLQAFERLASLATKAGVEGSLLKIHAPLIELSKAETIRKGISLGVDYSVTHSCYDPDEQGNACGKCDACAIRKRGFSELGLDDPAYSHA